MRLVHLTDPHLSSLDGVRLTDLRGKRWSGYLSWLKNRRKKYLPAVLEQLTAAVCSEDADQILLTGDLVHIGLETEIEQAARWLTTLGPPEQVVLVPGNHDSYASDSARRYEAHWRDYLFVQGVRGSRGFPVVRKLGGLDLIGLSTACVTPVFMASGELGAVQLGKLETLLAKAGREKRPVVLLIHHPPLPGMTSARKGLRDARKLQAVLERFPPLLVFHGHLHHNREYLWGNSRIYCTAAASRASDASYRVIDIEDHQGVRSVHMVLKSITVDECGRLVFATVDEQSWQASI
jgi:3',5'-cyclic AMP phosphodiesterase CpdA